MKSSNANAAEERAYNAAQYIIKARVLLEKRKSINALISAIEGTMKDEPVFASIIGFFIACLLEVVITWEMYRQIAAGNAPRFEYILTPCMAFIMVLWAALTAFYLGKKLRKPLFNLAQQRLEYTGVCTAIAIENTQIKMEKDFTIGWISAVLLFLTVVSVSFYRIGLLGRSNIEVNYDWFDLSIPMLFIGLEIFCGFYTGYAWFKITNYCKSKYWDWAFPKLAKLSFYETKMAVILYDEAMKEKEIFTPSKHLQDALYRWKHLSIENENYFDPI